MKVKFLPSILLLLSLGLAWAQETQAPEEKTRGPKRENRRRGPQRLRIAEIQKVEGDTITLTGSKGEARTITLDEDVRVEENTDLSKDGLEEGQSIFALGKADEQGIVHAKRILVLPEGVDPPKPRKRPEAENTNRPRPILGQIVSLDPLTVKGSDDETVQIALDEQVKIQQPQPIDKEALTPGTHVMVRFKRGEDGSPQLAALIKVSEEELERIRKREKAMKRAREKREPKP